MRHYAAPKPCLKESSPRPPPRNNSSKVFQESVQESAENSHSWFPLPAHCFDSRCFVSLIGAWPEPNKRWHSVPHREKVRPKPSRAPIAIREWMDSDPFCVSPGTEIHHRIEFLATQFFARRQHSVEAGNRHLQFLFEFLKFSGNTRSWYAPVWPNLHLGNLEALLAPETADVFRILAHQSLHERALPVASEF